MQSRAFLKSTFLSVFLFLFFSCCFPEMSFAGYTDKLAQALKKGGLSGAIGNYFEYTDKDAPDSDYGWSATYFTVKYETLRWKNLKFGARFFAHGESFNDHDDSLTDPFSNDIETTASLPELYLDYAFGENSQIRAGRYNHKKISHIDDAQSEGGYITFRELSGLEITAGLMKRFAEIDYDDGEDFGRKNKAQDLDSAAYGDGAGALLFYAEAQTFFLDEKVSLNPYFMLQDDYAAVYGIDVDIKTMLEDHGLTVGSKLSYYYVHSDLIGTSHSSNYSLFPYIRKGAFEITAGYAAFDDGDSFNKPAWLSDYFSILDQQKEYGAAGSQKIFAKIKFSREKFWSHYAMGDNQYDFAVNKGDHCLEQELQFGYQFTESLDINLRLFDVQYDAVDDMDYQRIESRIRFRF